MTLVLFCLSKDDLDIKQRLISAPSGCIEDESVAQTTSNIEVT